MFDGGTSGFDLMNKGIVATGLTVFKFNCRHISLAQISKKGRLSPPLIQITQLIFNSELKLKHPWQISLG